MIRRLVLEELPQCQKLIGINALIQKGVSKCKQTCQYFTYCGGGAPSNKLYENKTFDSTETMYCKLGKQALIDVVLDYLERKYGLPSVFGLSVVERVWRLQEQIRFIYDISVLKNNHSSKTNEAVQWDDFEDFFDYLL